MALRDIFETVVDYFDKQHIDYAVIGAFALYGFGYVRATRDIDFVVRLEDQGKSTGFLEQLGFETTHISQAFSNHVHPIGATRVDIMYLEGSTGDEVFSKARKRVLFNKKEYRVVAPEHLIAMKLFAAANNSDRRFRDLADVKEVVKRVGLSKGTVRALFVKYGLEDLYDDVIG